MATWRKRPATPAPSKPSPSSRRSVPNRATRQNSTSPWKRTPSTFSPSPPIRRRALASVSGVACGAAALARVTGRGKEGIVTATVAGSAPAT